MTRLTWGSDPVTGDWWFKGRITQDDMADLRLDALDRAIIQQPTQSAADVLLSAEIVFRRLAQQAAEKNTTSSD